MVLEFLGVGSCGGADMRSACTVSSLPRSCAHVAEEARGQPAGGGQARLLALPDSGHTETHSHLVQKPDAHLGGESKAGHRVGWNSIPTLPGAPPTLLFPRGCPWGGVGRGSGQDLVSQDSRFEVSKNGTLRINSVEVYDGTWYRCVSSTPAGSIEAQARVQVLGELARGEGLTGWAGEQREGAAGSGTSRPAPTWPAASTPP